VTNYEYTTEEKKEIKQAFQSGKPVWWKFKQASSKEWKYAVCPNNTLGFDWGTCDYSLTNPNEEKVLQKESKEVGEIKVKNNYQVGQIFEVIDTMVFAKQVQLGDKLQLTDVATGRFRMLTGKNKGEIQFNSGFSCVKLVEQPERGEHSEIKLGDIVEIIDRGKIYPNINSTNLITWPTQEIKEKGGYEFWNSKRWYPEKGNRGEVIHLTKHGFLLKRGEPVIYILKVYGYYVPIGKEGVKLVTQDSNYVEPLRGVLSDYRPSLIIIDDIEDNQQQENEAMNTIKDVQHPLTATLSTTIKSFKVEQVTYIVGCNGVRKEAEECSNEDVFNYIFLLEQEIEKLSEIKRKPKTLQAEIDRINSEITALVELVDARVETK